MQANENCVLLDMPREAENALDGEMGERRDQ